MSGSRATPGSKGPRQAAGEGGKRDSSGAEVTQSRGQLRGPGPGLWRDREERSGPVLQEEQEAHHRWDLAVGVGGRRGEEWPLALAGWPLDVGCFLGWVNGDEQMGSRTWRHLLTVPSLL